MCGIIGPRSRFVGAMGHLPHPEEDPVDDLVLVDGRGEGLAHPPVGKERMAEVIAEIGIGGCRITVFVETGTEFGGVGLALVLDRRKPHHVERARLELHVHGGIVGNDPVDVAVDVGRPS